MDLDALLRHYFGTSDISAIDAAAVGVGQEKLAVDFGVERDPGRRFALWALMHALGIAPHPDDAFKSDQEREAARRFARVATRAAQGQQDSDQAD